MTMIEETQISCDFTLLIRYIDECLIATGTQSLLDADKIRDQFLDFRTMIMAMSEPGQE